MTVMFFTGITAYQKFYVKGCGGNYNLLVMNTVSRIRPILTQILDLPNYQLCFIKDLLNNLSLSSLQNESIGLLLGGL